MDKWANPRLGKIYKLAYCNAVERKAKSDDVLAIRCKAEKVFSNDISPLKLKVCF